MYEERIDLIVGVNEWIQILKLYIHFEGREASILRSAKLCVIKKGKVFAVLNLYHAKRSSEVEISRKPICF